MELIPVVHHLLEGVPLDSHADDATSRAAAALILLVVYWGSVAVKAAVVRRRTGERVRLRTRLATERPLLALFAVDTVAWLLIPILVISGVDGALVSPRWRHPALTLSGAAVSAGAIVLSWISWVQMGDSWRMATTDRRLPLVTSGVFRWIRHPIYTGQAALMIGTAMLLPSPALLALCVVHACVVYRKARLEEQHLLGLHGEAYRAYRDRVGGFVPRR